MVLSTSRPHQLETAPLNVRRKGRWGNDDRRRGPCGGLPVLSAASRAEDAADIGVRGGHVWGFQFEAEGPTTTVVTEIYDCTQSPG